jgi:hypothetical protein
MTGSVIVGIDPGVNTGYAELRDGKLLACESLKLHEAWKAVRGLWLGGELKMVVFEDARLRTWFGPEKQRDQLQGAGSIKRDCSAWADFLADLGCPYKAIKPAKGATKWTADAFARLTGWQGRTNEHGRDAAMLIWGR